MCQVEAADRSRWAHGAALRELDAGLAVRVQKLEERPLLAMVRTGRIAERRSDAAIALLQDVVEIEVLAASVAPLVAHPLVQHLSVGLGEPVGQHARHDRAVVVVLGLETLDDVFESEARRDGKPADPVRDAGIDRGDPVREAEVRRRAAALLALLTHQVKAAVLGAARLVGVEHDVVAVGRRGEEPVGAMRLERPFLDDGLQQRLRVLEELARLLAIVGVLEDLRIRALELPGDEERCPVDPVDERLEGYVVRTEDVAAGVFRLGTVDLRPVEGRLARDGVVVAQDRAGVAPRVLGALFVVELGELGVERCALLWIEELRDDVRSAGGVLHVHDGAALIVRLDAHGSVARAGGRAADEQGGLESLRLHLAGDVGHLVERRRNQAAQTDDVGALLSGRREDRLRGHHHAEVDDAVAVAAEHDADDVLADVVHVSLDGGEQHGPGAVVAVVDASRGPLGLVLLEVGVEERDGPLHRPCALHDLRQEHAAAAEEVADDVHAIHQRPFDDVERARIAVGLEDLGQILLEVIGDAVDERVREAFFDGLFSPARVGPLPPRATVLVAVALGLLDEALGGVVTTVEDHVLAELTQLRLDVLVDGQLTGVDDAHVEAGLDGVIEKHRVHRLAHGRITAEAEAEVADAADEVCAREALLQLTACVDEVLCVLGVLFDARRDREDVGVEDDVLFGKADGLREDAMGAREDLDAVIERGRLPLLVEGHDDDGGPMALADARLLDEGVFALLEADRVDDRASLDLFEPSLDDAELRAVDHDRDARDVGLGRDQAQERLHRADGVEQPLVHVDVEDVRAALDLIARDLERDLELLVLDQAPEAPRARDVGALADHHEAQLRANRERLEAAQARQRGHLRNLARRQVGDGRADRLDVRRRRAAAAAGGIEPSTLGELADELGRDAGRLVVFAEGVGQTSVGVAGDR